jgi:hypothetical protein
MRRLWETEPLKSTDSLKKVRALPTASDVGVVVARRTTNFIPLVSEKMSLACRLQIDFYEPEGSLAIKSDVTDIDNRLKTLFDALRIPSEQEIELNHDYGPDFYCLMSDDKLIWEVNVKRTRLLRDVEKHDSLARLTVAVVETKQTFANMALVGGVIQ